MHFASLLFLHGDARNNVTRARKKKEEKRKRRISLIPTKLYCDRWNHTVAEAYKRANTHVRWCYREREFLGKLSVRSVRICSGELTDDVRFRHGKEVNSPGATGSRNCREIARCYAFAGNKRSLTEWPRVRLGARRDASLSFLSSRCSPASKYFHIPRSLNEKHNLQ